MQAATFTKKNRRLDLLIKSESDALTKFQGRSWLERSPKWLLCIPLVAQWLFLSARYKSLTLPTCANPNITAGGLVGEGKLEYFVSMGPLALAATAPHCALSTHQSYTEVELDELANKAGLSFPLIVKPDVGLCGYGVQRVANSLELLEYLSRFPGNERVVLQQWVAQEGEAGIFYVREPGCQNGRIDGLTLRYFPRVTGDGLHNLRDLIARDARAQRAGNSVRHSCKLDMTRIPEAGEVVRLATIGSTRVGGLYRDGAECISPQLTKTIDDIAQDMPNFYFGRFDVRFETLADLRAGAGLSIMEVNGAGTEAIQAWDPATGIWAGFAIIFRKQRTLFAIGDAMRRKGFSPIGVWALARLNYRQNRLVARYPPSN